jgi:hypothetical protein
VTCGYRWALLNLKKVILRKHHFGASLMLTKSVKRPERRGEMLRIRLSTSDAAWIFGSAEAAGMTMSDWARALLLKGKDTPEVRRKRRFSPEIGEAVRSLSDAGSRLQGVLMALASEPSGVVSDLRRVSDQIAQAIEKLGK